MSATNSIRPVPRLRVLALAIAITTGAGSAFAQAVDHSKMHMPPPAEKPVVTAKPATATKPPTARTAKPAVADPHAGHTMPPTAVDPHAGHAMPAPTAPAMTAKEHAAMGHAVPAPQQPAQEVDHAAMGHDMPMPSDQPRDPIPALTDADRIAAFPDVGGHAAHDDAIHSYWLLDRLEGWNAEEGAGIGWEALGWIGGDLDRIWLRSEGEHVDGAVESANAEVLYGRSIARWWDVVAGVRHDFGEGPSQTFAAIGVMGLAPQKFEIEATAYIGQSGQTAARVEAEYDTLLTNRLILQWQAEAEIYGKNDERRGIGSGLSTVEAGLRVRYEFTRKFAPYIGVAWERAYGGTADSRRDHQEDIDDTRFVAGLRIWF